MNFETVASDETTYQKRFGESFGFQIGRISGFTVASLCHFR